MRGAMQPADGQMAGAFVRQIVKHPVAERLEAGKLRFAQPGKHARVQRVEIRLRRKPALFALRRQVQAVAPRVGRIAAPADQTALFQPLQARRRGGRGDVQLA